MHLKCIFDLQTEQTPNGIFPMFLLHSQHSPLETFVTSGEKGITLGLSRVSTGEDDFVVKLSIDASSLSKKTLLSE